MSSSKSAVPHVFITHLHPNKLASMTVRGSSKKPSINGGNSNERYKGSKWRLPSDRCCDRGRSFHPKQLLKLRPGDQVTPGQESLKIPQSVLQRLDIVSKYVSFIFITFIHAQVHRWLVHTTFLAFFLIFKSMYKSHDKYYIIIYNNHIRFIFFPHGPWASLIRFKLRNSWKAETRLGFPERTDMTCNPKRGKPAIPQSTMILIL